MEDVAAQIPEIAHKLFEAEQELSESQNDERYHLRSASNGEIIDLHSIHWYQRLDELRAEKVASQQKVMRARRKLEELIPDSLQESLRKGATLRYWIYGKYWNITYTDGAIHTAESE